MVTMRHNFTALSMPFCCKKFYSSVSIIINSSITTGGLRRATAPNVFQSYSAKFKRMTLRVNLFNEYLTFPCNRLQNLTFEYDRCVREQKFGLITLLQFQTEGCRNSFRQLSFAKESHVI